MKLRHLWLLLSILAAAWSTGNVSAKANSAHWVWCDVDRQAGVRVSFRKEFEVDEPVTSAVLRVAAESASLSIVLADETIADLEPYDPLLTLEVADQLRDGIVELSIRGVSGPGPAAFFLSLDLTFASGRQQTIVSDKSWRVVREGPASEQPAVSLGLVGRKLLIPADRHVGITAVDNYEQWKQALGAEQGSDPASFAAAPGFEVELVRSARDGEDSWVSLAFDPQGRAIIAKEKQGLLRMTLDDGGGRVTQTDAINDSLLECRGLQFIGDDLYANANNSKGLYRLTSDGQGGFSQPELLLATSGGVGHGRNDLAVGPDGKLYSIHGDSVDLPEAARDATSPLRAARRGEKTREGHLLRIDPDRETVEVLAAGLRNPFGIDFNAEGDVFTYDADAEFDMGSPWYRPTRVSHLVTGGDYGWRGVTGSWPPYYPDHPDNALPNLDIGKGSPTAVKFGAGSSFPHPYRDALFILDWAYGRILAVHMVPRGSSYLMAGETFLKGRPLNVTDLDFGPDGAMYLVTGGRGTRSALYRVRYRGESPPSPAATAQQQARVQFAARARQTRRRLEAYLLTAPDPDAAINDAWSSLAEDDPWLRHAARNVLEHQPRERWQSRALAESDRRAALTALLALARAEEDALREPILRRLNQFELASADRSERLSAAYLYDVCLQSPTELPGLLRQRVVAPLEPLYPDPSYQVNRVLSQLLVRLESKTAVAKTIELLTATTDQAEQLHYLFVLRNARTGWTPGRRATYLHGLAAAGDFLGGQGMPGFIQQIRDEATAALDAEQRRTFASLLAPSQTASAPPAAARPVVRQWKLEELVEALPAHDEPRDLRRGEALFAAASCIQCHRLAGRGTLIGPDLTAAGRRFTRRNLLEAIITPSQVIPEKYRSLQVVTTEGQVYVGRPALGGDFRSPVLRLAVDPRQPFKTIEISKSEIAEQRASPTSWMPRGLLDTLTRDEILDLLAYIEAGGTRPE